MGPAHLGIGFAAKKTATDVPLWVLLVASEALDLLSFGFCAIGVEKFAATQISLEKAWKSSPRGMSPGHTAYSCPWCGLLPQLLLGSSYSRTSVQVT